MTTHWRYRGASLADTQYTGRGGGVDLADKYVVVWRSAE
jgi:hypothetical protein